MKASDLNFVFDSWMKSWRTNKSAGVIPNHLFYQVQRELIEGLIARGAQIYIAHPSDREDFILGWACTEEKDGATVLHYIYVKDPYLNLYGIERTLLQAVPGSKPGFLTHQLGPKWKAWRHAPEIARRKQL